MGRAVDTTSDTPECSRASQLSLLGPAADSGASLTLVSHANRVGVWRPDISDRNLHDPLHLRHV